MANNKQSHDDGLRELLDSLYIPNQHPVQFAIQRTDADALFRNGFEDTSWRNDICASFTLHEKEQCIRIWVESVNIRDRESESRYRYAVARYTADMDDGTQLLETNSLNEALGCAMANKTFAKPSPDASETKDTIHSVIHTGGNIYNDIISDFDKSGRIIVVSEGGIRLFANDRDYQCGCDPIAWASGPSSDWESKCGDCGAHGDWESIGTVCGNCKRGVMHAGEYEPCEPDSQIADIESTTDYVFIRDTSGATLMVWRDNSE